MTQYSKIRTTVLFAAIASCLTLFGGLTAAAQDDITAQGLIPAQNTVTVDAEHGVSSETHPPLRLTPDKSEILNVDGQIERVIIGNDAHVNILLDTSSRIIVVPRAPGATHITLMGKNGKIIMQRHVIIAGPKQNYVRIKRSCSLASSDCAPTQIYYCPGICHEIALPDDNTSSASSAAPLPSHAAFGMGVTDNPSPPLTHDIVDE